MMSKVIIYSVLRALSRFHLAVTALRAASLRSSAVIAAALAGPPFFPPLRPRATAAGFFRFAMQQIYMSAHEKAIDIT